MAANQTIINAAGAAYSPAKGQYNISGFVNGIASVAQGLVTRKKLIGQRQSSAAKIYVKTDNATLQARVDGVTNQYKNFNINEKQMEGEILKIKEDNATIGRINKLLVNINKEGLALNGGPIEEAWYLGVKDGSLTDGAQVRINTKSGSFNKSTFYEYDENGVLLMLAPSGEMLPATEVEAMVEQMPTRKLKEKFNLKMRDWQNDTYGVGKESQWGAKKVSFVGAVIQDIFKDGRDKSTMYTSLIDNMAGFDVTNGNNVTKNFNWHDWYLDPKNNALTADQKAEYDRILDGYDEDVRDRAKGIVLKEIMDGDKSLMTDVKNFITQIADYKKPEEGVSPIPIISEKTARTGFQVKGKLNKSDAQDLAIIGSLEQSIVDVKGMQTSVDIGKVASTAKGGKIELVRGADDEGKETYYFRHDAAGKKDKEGNIIERRLSGNFVLREISEEGYQELMLKVIQEAGVAFGGDGSIYRQYETHITKE
jgi:hypothetical protein